MDHTYAGQILKPHVVPYAAAILDSFILTHECHRPHKVRLMETMFVDETAERMEPQGFSANPNQLDHV